ncbi:MAG: cell wall metabolism sensor histidine kinase WalK, partial [Helicobacteraceae bacterium]|nr:cell wall metabolism sensor histidine kinase WalK [Helicobacteraceae bacterium]
MKFFNSFKFRFAGLLSLFIIVLIGIMSVLGIRQLSKAVSQTFASQGIHIVEKAASIVDGNSFEALAKSKDSNDPFYEKTRVQLLGIKELSGCTYLYTMSQIKENTWQYVIDGSVGPDDADNFSNIGDEEDTSSYDDAFRRVLISGKTESGNLVNQEEWGWMVSTYAPIKNSAGKIVGITGCDYDGNNLHNTIIKDIWSQIFVSGIFLLIGLALILFLLRQVFSPLSKLSQAIINVSETKNFADRLKVDSNDEIAQTAQSFNQLLEALQTTFKDLHGFVTQFDRASEELAALSDKVAKASTNTSDSSSDMAASVEEMTASIATVGENARET